MKTYQQTVTVHISQLTDTQNSLHLHSWYEDICMLDMRTYIAHGMRSKPFISPTLLLTAQLSSRLLAARNAFIVFFSFYISQQ